MFENRKRLLKRFFLGNLLGVGSLDQKHKDSRPLQKKKIPEWDFLNEMEKNLGGLRETRIH